MNRVNVYDPETRELVGWFDIDAAEKFSEDTYFDGSNQISKATGSQWNHETLYRTKGGRWVLNCWSQWQGSRETWEFISEAEAREWLIAQSEDEAVKRYFGELEEERGPGRPEIGPAIQVRLPENLLTKVDARADAEGVSRAEMIRELLAKALDQQATAKARLRWEHTVYCDGRGGEYPAILIRWQDVKTFLGELHNGDPEQDERLVDGLLAAGAPDWVREAPGWVDENGWGLYSMGEEA